METRYRITIEGEGTQDEIEAALKDMSILVGIDGNLADGDPRWSLSNELLEADLIAVPEEKESKANNMNWGED